jgi:uncharacterized membrane protein YbhN (UPF0104 family)
MPGEATRLLDLMNLASGVFVLGLGVYALYEERKTGTPTIWAPLIVAGAVTTVASGAHLVEIPAIASALRGLRRRFEEVIRISE